MSRESPAEAAHRPTSTLSRRERVIAALPAVLLVVVAAFHLAYLHPHAGMSKWKGGGLGVYCAPYERRVATWVDLGDGPALARVTPYPGAKFFGGWFPYVPYTGDGWLEDHGGRILTEPHADAEPLDGQRRARPDAGAGRLPLAATVQEWRYHFDSETRAHWRLVRRWRGSRDD